MGSNGRVKPNKYVQPKRLIDALIYTISIGQRLRYKYNDKLVSVHESLSHDISKRCLHGFSSENKGNNLYNHVHER